MEVLRALLIEDSDDDALLIVRRLREAAGSLEFERVQTEEALAGALMGPPWDVVISDYRLPQLDGEAALRIVREWDEDLPFIFVSGTIGEEAAAALVRGGADDYVMKGNLERLPTSIEQQLAAAKNRRARRSADKAARESEFQLRQLAENIQAFFYLQNIASGEYIYASRAFEGIWGRPVEELYSSPAVWKDAIHPDDRDPVERGMKLRAIEPTEVNYRIVRPDGAIRWVRSRGFPVADFIGRPYRIAGIVEDETERKAAQDRINRLSRTYRVLSGINALIVRVRHKDELLREACRIAVEAGRFPLAWIGTASEDGRRIKPVAWAGDAEGYIEHMPLGLDGSLPEDFGMAPMVFKEAKAMVANDMGSDSRIKIKQAALARGFRSLAVLPLTPDGRTVGVLALYAEQQGFFDEEEMRLLEELAADVSFALDHIDKLERVDHLAYYDQVTDLPSAKLFTQRLESFLTSSAAAGRKVAVAALDVARFRTINESLGRQVGDALLRQVGERLRTYSRTAESLVARVAADRFILAAPVVLTEANVARATERGLLECFGAPFAIGGQEIRISARVGLAIFPDNGGDPEALFRNAEAALTKAKATGARYLFFEQQMTERVSEKLALENRLRTALEREEFVLHYQPQVDLKTGKVTGAEALIRWQNRELGLVPPAHFIPLMEETGLILDVGVWALGQAVRDRRAWASAGLPAPRVSVNVSAIQLHQPNFVETVTQALGHPSADPAIDLELTESLLMQDLDRNVAKLRSLLALGVRVAIDDFGTGHSSLAYLAKLPVHCLKIDRSFVITMLKEKSAMSVVRMIISLAHSMELKVVAEGVDSKEQASALRALGCDEMQGYLFSRPVPAHEFSNLLAGQAGARRSPKGR